MRFQIPQIQVILSNMNEIKRSIAFTIWSIVIDLLISWYLIDFVTKVGDVYLQVHTILSYIKKFSRSHGVTASTLDSESSDPSSNLGETFNFLRYIFFLIFTTEFFKRYVIFFFFSFFSLFFVIISSYDYLIRIYCEIKLYMYFYNFS